jgi:predicted ATP-dependent endonuclease of OLD family
MFFEKGLNSIVGEDNAGKSSILRVLNILTKSYAFSEEDFPNGDTKKKMQVNIEIKLESAEAY